MTEQRLWLANIAPGTTDEELEELVRKYAPDIECVAIQREDGNGLRPRALMAFTGKKFDSLGKLALRLNGMYWKGRRLAADVMLGA
jgi:hypothetical protein